MNESSKTTQAAFTCLKLIIEKLDVRGRSGVFSVTSCSSVFVVNFEHIDAGWVIAYRYYPYYIMMNIMMNINITNKY